jgi:uncharacterized protein YneF (UPF0154 family)
MRRCCLCLLWIALESGLVEEGAFQRLLREAPALFPDLCINVLFRDITRRLSEEQVEQVIELLQSPKGQWV